MVTSPEPVAGIEMMALYLDYQKVTAEDLLLGREAVELACIDRVVVRRHEPTVVDRLRAAAARVDDHTGGELNRLSHVPHAEIGELSGNPVLALFPRIVTEISQRHADATEPRPIRPDLPDRALSDPVKLAHQRIVEAILDGNGNLARYRMRRHLGAVGTWWA